MIFPLFHIEIEGKCGWIIGGGAKGYVGPPSQIIGGGLAPPGPPSSYAYVQFLLHAALPKACSNRKSIESGKSLFISLFYMTLNCSNLLLLLCENEKLPHTYSKVPWSMCVLEMPKRISLFNRPIDTFSKLVKIKRSYLLQLPWQYKKLHV